MRIKNVFKVLLLMGANFLGYAADLQSITFKEAGGKMSVLLAINGTYNYKAFILPNPHRIVVDLKQTSTKIDVKRLLPTNTFIANIRSGRPNANDLRIVFDLKNLISIRSTPNDQGLTLELGASKTLARSKPLLPKTKALITKASLPTVKSKPIQVAQTMVTVAPKPMQPVHITHSPARNTRDVIIVLDPGHGGKDPGAIGPRRNAEKNVTLGIAKRLKRLIDSQPGMRAVLTRKGDYYVGLRERLNIARKSNADIFISIHADAFINQHSSGASVFALSQTGATSEAAHWLAEKENYSELGGVNLSDLDDKLVRTVLIDLSQTATIGASLQMGAKVLQNLDQITNLHNNKVEQARFMVLKSPDIPSILIETGFITNPREERNLTSASYQAQLTQAILNGLKHYFSDHPPQGTRMEAMVTGNYRYR